MIQGLGTDIVRISRIEALLVRFGDKFAQRCFTDTERKRANGKAHPAAAYARLYAAKEAALKALGTGMREGLSWHDMDVGHNELGAPCMSLTGGMQNILQEKGFKKVRTHLSMSDDGDYGIATFMLATI